MSASERRPLVLEKIPLGSCVDGRYWKIIPTDVLGLPESYLYDPAPQLPMLPGMRVVDAAGFKAAKWQKPSQALLTTGLHYANNRSDRGTDPEFFLTERGERIPAFMKLPAKSETKMGWFWDGFQGETTVGADNCHEVIAQNIAYQMRKLKALGLNISDTTVWRVPDVLLENASDAQVALGCDPSENAYGLVGRKVEYPRFLKWRFAGGHIHQSMQAQERQNKAHVEYIVRTMDAFLGVPAVALFQNYDRFIRRRYYGLAGEYRLPSHGLEYRVLSNAWAFHPLSFMLTFDLARFAFSLGRAHMRRLFVGDRRTVVDTINNCDVKTAQALMDANKETYNTWLDWRYRSAKPFWEAIKGGIDKVIPNFGKDIVGAWEPIERYDDAPHWARV